MPVIELSTQLRTIVSRLAALNEQRQTIEAEDKRLKAELRLALGVGTQGAVDGTPVVSVNPNRRFQAALAAQVLPPALLDLCKTTVIDSKAAKAVLPPAMYEQCMGEVGEPVVRLA